MMKKSITGVSLCALMLAVNANALTIDEKTPVKSNIILTKPVSNTLAAKPAKKQVYLMNIQLSAKEKAAIFNYHPKATVTLAHATTDLPPAVNVGMNDTPVLDQGRHGSCVTFAVTAAVDALFDAGDAVSQLCNLELGRYLKLQSYYPSGWNGSFAPWVLDQINRFGIVTKYAQVTKSCAGVTQYSLDDEEEIGNIMKPEEYKSLSISLADVMYWRTVLHFNDRLDNSASGYDGEKVLNEVKSTLASNQDTIVNMVVFGTLLPVDYCQVGACASHVKPNDTWTLTDSINNDPNPSFGGHEMVITGYDDNAVVTDNEGKQHTGLLTLRNSWGEDAGNNGDYYMTYDFFEKFVMEVNRLAATNTEDGAKKLKKSH